jgi:hypothetical protein
MARTMSETEHEELKQFIVQKSKELTKKQDIINYLTKVGFCDENGKTVFPYNSLQKKK